MNAGRWVVSGLVQGVGFRWFVHRHATELGLVGWVRNLATGDVEVVAAGPPGALHTLEGQLQRGPSMARVTHVEKSHVPHEVSGYKSFEIM